MWRRPGAARLRPILRRALPRGGVRAPPEDKPCSARGARKRSRTRTALPPPRIDRENPYEMRAPPAELRRRQKRYRPEGTRAAPPFVRARPRARRYKDGERRSNRRSSPATAPADSTDGAKARWRRTPFRAAGAERGGREA